MENLEKDKLVIISDATDDLKDRSIRGGLLLLLGQALKLVLQVVVTVVLARVLTPSDFGLVAMVTVVSNLARIVGDLGLPSATIQSQSLNHSQLSNLFWINLAIGGGIMGTMSASAPLLADFYNEPKLISVTIATSLSFVFSGASAQHLALLRKQMRFATQMVVETIAMAAGAVVAIIIALQRKDYWALVLQQLTVTALVFCGVWFIVSWRPSFPKMSCSVRKFISFGGDITAFNLVNYVSRNLDDILIGKFYGRTTLGFYIKAYNLLMMPIVYIQAPISTVALPSLSKLQSDPEKFRKYYTQLLGVLAFVTIPVMTVCVALPKGIVSLVLGEQWMGAVPIFRILSVAGLIQPLSGTIGLVLIALGQTKRYRKLGVATSVIYALSFIVGLPWGAKGVALSYTVAVYLVLVPSLCYSLSVTPIGMKDFFRALVRPTIASLFVFLLCVISTIVLKINFSMQTIGGVFALSALVYFLAWFSLPGGVIILKSYKESLLLAVKRVI